MWQTLMNWLPDLRIGSFEIRDLVSLLMTAVGAYLAWLAIRMGRRQAAIAEMQYQISAKQDALLRDQLAKKAELSLVAHTAERTAGAIQLGLHVWNVGGKTANGVYWTVTIQEPFASFIELRPSVSSPVIVPVTKELFGKGVLEWKGFTADPVFPTREGYIARLAFQRNRALQQPQFIDLTRSMPIFYQLIGEDGKFEGSLDISLNA